VWAISNIENERPSLPEQGLSGSLKLGYDGKTGNQAQKTQEFGSKLVYRDDADIYIAIINREYGSKHEIKTTDNSFLHGRWVHLLNNQWALEGFAQWEKDEFDNLNSRVLAGAGGRYTIAQEADVYSFALGFGGFREHEKVDLVDHEEINHLWRVNTYYSYKYQINNQLSLVNTTYYQPSVKSPEDYRVLFDLGVNVKVSKRFALTFNYKLSHDSQPAENVNVDPIIQNHATNSEYKTALTYHF
jgi:putative salt-induced outer membrane protein YdiY